MNDRIYRTVEDRMLLGVMGGISLRLGMDPSIVRVIYAIVTVLSGIFPLVIAYVIMAIVIPEAPPAWERSMRAAGPGGSPGAGAAGPTGWGTEAAEASGAAGWATADAAMGSSGAGAAGAAADPAAPGPAWGAGWDAAASDGERASGRRRGDDPRVGAIVGGLVLLGLGSLFLLVQVVPGVDWGVLGPAALVGLGVILILASIRRA